MLSDLLEQLAAAAIAEALSVPKLIDRQGDIWWRGKDGKMVQITAYRYTLGLTWSEP